jgi:cobalt-zinc-cadmium resistance protein CzcA
MSGLPRMTEIRSLSKYGLSVVTVVFDDGTDIYFARQLVNERMRGGARGPCRRRTATPEMGPISTGLGEIYPVHGAQRGALELMELEELLDWYIAPQLRTVPGRRRGQQLRRREPRVPGDAPSPAAAGAGAVARARGGRARASNANAGGGYIEHNQEHFVIGSRAGEAARTSSGWSSARRRRACRSRSASVGERAVRAQAAARRGDAGRRGRGGRRRGADADGRELAHGDRGDQGKLDGARTEPPRGVAIEPFYDRTLLVDRTIRRSRPTWRGRGLVIVVLLLLLGDLRAGLVVATTIPLAMLFAVIVMNALGLSGNLMSLGAIDFGLIVDGAVIVVENAVRRLAEAREAAKGRLTDGRARPRWSRRRRSRCAARRCSARSSSPSCTCRSSRCRGGGQAVPPDGDTVLFALAGAFVFSLTVVPVLTSYLVRPKAGQRETWLLRQAHRVYVPVLAGRCGFRVATLDVGDAAGSPRACCCSPAWARSSCRSWTRATCWWRRGGCPGRR